MFGSSTAAAVRRRMRIERSDASSSSKHNVDCFLNCVSVVVRVDITNCVFAAYIDPQVMSPSNWKEMSEKL